MYEGWTRVGQYGTLWTTVGVRRRGVALLIAFYLLFGDDARRPLLRSRCPSCLAPPSSSQPCSPFRSQHGMFIQCPPPPNATDSEPRQRSRSLVSIDTRHRCTAQSPSIHPVSCITTPPPICAQPTDTFCKQSPMHPCDRANTGRRQEQASVQEGQRIAQEDHGPVSEKGVVRHQSALNLQRASGR